MNRLLLVTLFSFAPILAHGATYYVAKIGSDGNTCTQAQSSLSPKLTIKAGLACLSGGDTLIIKAGTYTEIVSGGTIPSGISDGARTTVQASSGETVIINGIDIYSRGFITVSGLIFNGYPNHIGRATTADAPSTFITFENVTARNWSPGASSSGGGGFNVGFRQEGVSSNIKLVNCTAHNNGGNKLDHGVYVSSRDNIIDGGSFYNNSGHGIHVYSGTSGATNNTVVRNVIARNNGSYGIGLYSGTNLLAYNNVVYGNGSLVAGSGGISLRMGGLGRLYYNTVYGNTNCGIQIEGTENVVRNNVSYNNTGTDISNTGTSTVLSNNIITDPLFVNAGAADFNLLATSPAIDKGMTINDVLTDFNGVPRPQGNSPDVGAFENIGAQLPVPPTNLRLVGTN